MIDEESMRLMHGGHTSQDACDALIHFFRKFIIFRFHVALFICCLERPHWHGHGANVNNDDFGGQGGDLTEFDRPLQEQV